VLRTAVRERAAGAAAGLALATVALFAATGTVAHADAPTLRVTNLGQSSAPVEVGQPALEIAAMGTCASPFTLANESACPAGAWPPLGRQWGSIEDVAGGDTLRFEFSSPVSVVKVGSTSNYTPGLHDPDGRAIPNYDVVSESAAVSTSDPAVWVTTLPPLDYRAISTAGYTFSVAAQDGSGYHDYPFGIRSPRYANELTQCGTAYFSTGVSQYLCLDRAVKGPRSQGARITSATYNGHVLTLTGEVPAAGSLRVGVPTICGKRAGGACHRRTWVVGRAAHRGRVVIRKALSLRLGRGRPMIMQIRFGTSADDLSFSTSRVKVHITSGIR